MNGTSHVLVFARAIRLAAAAAAIVFLVGFVALQSFGANHGLRADPRVLDAGEPDPALAHRISQQEANGRTCQARPTLTDVVLFQRLGEPGVQVLSFDEALVAAAAREGLIRRYCV